MNMSKDTNNKILAIICSDKEKYLLLKTNPKTMKEDVWYVVSGSVKEGEKLEDAVKREVKEETQLDIISFISLGVSYKYEWPKNSGKMKNEKAFLVRVRHSEPKITRFEHTNWKWLDKTAFLDEIDWEGNKKELVKMLSKQ
jgi:NADH pyrophosphatase NudC (nudix superfamily)